MKINKYIDLTLLKAEATSDDIKELCDIAKQHNVKSVCVNSSFVAYAKELLKDSDVLVCTVVGFPLGANTTFAKVAEAQLSVQAGADEIDMVLHIGKLKEHDLHYIEQEVELMNMMLKGIPLKVIIEINLLTEPEIIAITGLLDELGVAYIKTCTGFNGSVTVEHIKLIKKHIAGNMKIKASGGINSHKLAVSLIEAGADRMGASKVELLDD